MIIILYVCLFYCMIIHFYVNMYILFAGNVNFDYHVLFNVNAKYIRKLKDNVSDYHNMGVWKLVYAMRYKVYRYMLRSTNKNI